MTALILLSFLLCLPVKGKARQVALSDRGVEPAASRDNGTTAVALNPASRSESAHPIRRLSRHTNAVLRAKCLPRHTSLPRTWQQARLWHLQAHRAKKSTCAPPTPWPSWWYRQAMCIHHYEGSFTADTGNGYGGGYQFLVSTFNRAAGGAVPYVSSTGHIARLSPFVQTIAAYRIWRQDGGSWREWGTAGMCGLA